MLSYLLQAGMQDSYEALSRDANITDFDSTDPKAKSVGLLEKKWTSVIRLQKKVSDSQRTMPTTDHGPGIPKRCIVDRAGITYTSHCGIKQLCAVYPPRPRTADAQLPSLYNYTSRLSSNVDRAGERE